MKITALNVYPIKALRPIPLESAILTRQGILHDRTYMLFKVNPDSSLRKMQLSTFPQCALFSQEIVTRSTSRPLDHQQNNSSNHDDENDINEDGNDGGDTILVRYHRPSPALIDHHPLQDTTLSVPLVPPDPGALETVQVDLHGSPALALRMSDPYDAFFSACFGFPTILVHIGSGRRAVLGSLAPGSLERLQHQQQQQQQPLMSSMFSSIASYLSFGGISPSTQESPDRHSGSNKSSSHNDDDPWLTFTDCAPYLVTSTSSLACLAPSLPDCGSSSSSSSRIMSKFRPNVVVDDDSEAPFAEDYWAELDLPRTGARLLLTANCGRCSSLNVDYDLGRPAAGAEGTILKTLMKDRRIDPGHKYAPVFGRYAFLAVDRDRAAAEDDWRMDGIGAGSDSESESAAAEASSDRVRVRVGDEVHVTRRNAERTVFDWLPLVPAAAVPDKVVTVA